MTDEQQILERLERLERFVVETRLPDYSIVGAEYVAKLFDCSPEAVVRGRFGTDAIMRVRNNPAGFRKADVHRVLKNLSKTAEEIAAAERGKARSVKRRKTLVSGK